MQRKRKNNKKAKGKRKRKRTKKVRAREREIKKVKNIKNVHLSVQTFPRFWLEIWGPLSVTTKYAANRILTTSTPWI